MAFAQICFHYFDIILVQEYKTTVSYQSSNAMATVQ
jgi:hypothetical protein